MNQKFTDNNDADDIARKLNRVAEQTNVSSQFAAELEERLRSTRQPKAGWLMSSFREISPVLRWATLMVLLVVVLSWSIKSLIPTPQPFNNSTPNGFVCPVTQPNGSLPYGKTGEEDPNFHGNGQLWTKLWPNGKIYMLPADQLLDGSFSQKWYFERGVQGALTIEGHRLDAEAPPLRADIPQGYGDTGLQVLALIFPTTGCWEVTGHVGDVSLTFVTEVVFGQATPTPSLMTTPNLITNGSATPVAQEGGYAFRGAKLFLQQPLPASPDKVHVYVLKKDQQATQEQARALADRFGIQGEMYTAPGYISGTTDYVISDGKQSLQVHSDKYFTYAADMGKSHRAFSKPLNPDAEAIIGQFLSAHGFDFPFRVYASEFFNGYVVQPLAPDSIPLQYESFTPPMMRLVLDENGQVLTIDASLMDYDPNPVGEYGIISAQEAFDKLLDDSVTTGKMDFFHSPSNLPQEWYREYPDNQTVSTYGYLSTNPAVDSAQPALILLDGVPLTGNTAGLESLEAFSFIKATGQYSVENGIRKFNVQSWDRKISQAYLSGTLSRQGDQIVLTSDDGSGKQYQLIDPPADAPLDTKIPESQLAVTGVIVDGKFFWTYIQYFENNGNGGGGGGGGGLGFYKLNLSGTPVPFPSPTPRPETNNNNPIQLAGVYTVKDGDTLTMIAQNFGTTVDVLMQLNALTDSNIYIGQTLSVPMPEATERKVEDLRGYLSITIHNKGDGTSAKEYNLEVTQENGSSLYTMEGDILGELDAYNGLPILINGTINTSGKLVVDSYKIPYPDLHFQILKGTQKTQQVDGQNVILFTTEDGASYVEYLVTNNIPNDRSITGYQGDLIQQEVLIIPDETFGGMPVAHIYQSSIIQENGPEMEIQANTIHVYNDSSEPSLPGDLIPADLTIDKVELSYFVSNPYYQVNDPNYSLRSSYIQPVWHFHGRYDDGSEFDVLIQALKQEFLLPELVPNAGMG